MRVVLDTNIYLSGLAFPASPPALILNFARQKKFETYCSGFIIEEIRRNLISKFDFSDKAAEQLIKEILKFVIIIIPKNKVNKILTKKDDNRILECALAARADYLVTGDKKHILPLKNIGKTKIIGAADFIKKLKK